MSVSSSAKEPVETIVDILDGQDSSQWTLTDPTVLKWWDHTQAERGPGDDQPAELYVWQTSSSPLERFSADNVLLQDEPTLEVWVYTLSESDTAQYARDTIQILAEYMDNQMRQTDFVDIAPTGIEDFREQKITEKTGHYVYTVELEMERLEDINQ